MRRRAFLLAIPAVAVAAKALPATPGLDRYLTANVWTTGRTLTEPMLLSFIEQMRQVNALRSQALDARILFGPPRYFR